MARISVQDLQRDVLGFLRRVEQGETLLVIDGDRVIAEVNPVPPRSSRSRPFGLAAGQFKVPDDFDAPLPEAVLRDFEG